MASVKRTTSVGSDADSDQINSEDETGNTMNDIDGQERDGLSGACTVDEMATASSKGAYILNMHDLIKISNN